MEASPVRLCGVDSIPQVDLDVPEVISDAESGVFLGRRTEDEKAWDRMKHIRTRHSVMPLEDLKLVP